METRMAKDLELSKVAGVVTTVMSIPVIVGGAIALVVVAPFLLGLKIYRVLTGTDTQY